MSKKKRSDLITEQDFNQMAATRGVPHPQEDNSNDTQQIETELGEHFKDGNLEEQVADLDEELDSPLHRMDPEQVQFNEHVASTNSAGEERSSTWPDASEVA